MDEIPEDESLAVPTPMKEMQVFLEGREAELLAIAHTDVDPQKILKLFSIAMMRNHDLADCTKGSVLDVLLEAARLNLDISGRGNSAHIVTFRNRKKQIIEAKLMPGYGGLIDLVTRSGNIQLIEVSAVYESDEFSWQRGTNPMIKHLPDMEADRTKKARWFYAVAFYLEHAYKFEVMSVGEVEAIRLASNSKDSPAWNSSERSYNEMGKKTVIRRLCKTLTLNPDAQRGVELMDEADSLDRGVRRKRGERTGPEKGTTIETLKAQVEARKSGEELAEPSGAPSGGSSDPEEDEAVDIPSMDPEFDAGEISRMMEEKQ